MLLTTQNVTAYLLDNNLVSSADLVDGAFEVLDVSGRNRNFIVRTNGGRGCFVKQAGSWDAQTLAMLRCEAACYATASEDPVLSSIAPFMPTLLGYDIARQVLVLDLVSEGRTLRQVFAATGALSPAVARRHGEAMGACHGGRRRILPDSPALAMFPRQRPWILSTDRRNSGPFKELTPATTALLDRVDTTAGILEALHQLGASWRTDALMHGDMRWDNCLIVEDAGGEAKIHIIDWELADVGDAGWDVGSSFAANLLAEVMAPGARLKQATQLMWRGYAASRRFTHTEQGEFALRCIGFAVVRLVQIAYELAQFRENSDVATMKLLHRAEALWSDRERFAQTLLDVP